MDNSSTAKTLICRHCGYVNALDSAFCNECGSRIEEQAPRGPQIEEKSTGFRRLVAILGILTLVLGVIALSLWWALRPKTLQKNELVSINTQRVEFHKKLLRAFPELEGKEIYGYDLDGDKEEELFILMDNKERRVRENSRIRVMKKRGRKYEPEAEFETMPGSLSNVRIVAMNGKEKQHSQSCSEKEGRTGTPEEKVITQLAFDFTYGGSGGFGATYIIFYRDRFEMVSTTNLSPYCARCEELQPGQWEILAREYAGGSGTDKLYVDTIYHWNGGSSFTNVSSEYGEYYQKFIDSRKNEISSSPDAGRANDAEYIDSRTKGIISAWRISDSPSGKMGPEDTVRKYFSLVEAKDFAEAYIYLSEARHKWQPYGKYVKGFNNEDSMMHAFDVKLHERSGGTFTIDVCNRSHGSEDSNTTSEKIRYTLIQEDGIWKIDKGDPIESVSGKGTMHNYLVIAGCFVRENEAEKHSQMLIQKGITCEVKRSSDFQGLKPNLFIILRGGYSSEEEASLEISRLKAQGIDCYLKPISQNTPGIMN